MDISLVEVKNSSTIIAKATPGRLVCVISDLMMLSVDMQMRPKRLNSIQGTCSPFQKNLQNNFGKCYNTEYSTKAKATKPRSEQEKAD